jgi:hypothetical protein
MLSLTKTFLESCEHLTAKEKARYLSGANCLRDMVIHVKENGGNGDILEAASQVHDYALDNWAYTAPGAHRWAPIH